MIKSILVFDTPKSCRECPCCNCTEYDTYCGMTDMQLEYDFEHGYVKPDWCPLKEMPERKDVNWLSDNAGWALGWNACLEEILEK